MWPVLTDRSARNCQTRLRPNCGGSQERRTRVPTLPCLSAGGLTLTFTLRGNEVGPNFNGLRVAIGQGFPLASANSLCPRALFLAALYTLSADPGESPHYAAAAGSSTYASSH